MNETTPARRRLCRTTDRKMLTGVCGGFAEYFAVDPVVVRVIVVVGSLLTGFLPFVYLVLIFVIPKQNEPEAAFDRFMSRRRGSSKSGRQLGAFSLIGLGVLLLFDRLGIGIGADVWFPFALVIGGGAVLLNQRHQQADALSTAFPSAADFSVASDAGSVGDPSSSIPHVTKFADSGSLSSDRSNGSLAAEGSEASGSAVEDGGRLRPLDPAIGLAAPIVNSGPIVSSGPTRKDRSDRGFITFATASNSPSTPRPVKKRSPYSRAAVGMFVLGIGALVLSKRAVNISIAGQDLAAIALIGLGVLMTLGAWLGRPRLLPTVGVVLALFVATAPSFGPVGTRTLTPLTVNEIPKQIELSVGAMAIDLSRLRVEGKRVTVRAKVGVGALTVEVPPGTAVEVRGKTSVGELVVFGRRTDGLGNINESVREGNQSSDGGILLILSSGIGMVEVAEKGKLLNPLSIESTAPIVPTNHKDGRTTTTIRKAP